MIEALILLTTKYLFYPILIGVVSTVCYVLVFDQLLKKVLIPWYFSRQYKSTKIDGKWVGGCKEFTFEFFLKQTGDRVNGEIIANTVLRSHKDGTEDVKIVESNTYFFEGEIKDGFVRMIHKEKDRNSFGFGSFLFQIAGGGKVLNGSVLYVVESDTGYYVSTAKDIKLERV